MDLAFHFHTVFVACGHVQIGGIKGFILSIFYYFFFSWVLIHGHLEKKSTTLQWFGINSNKLLS